ncbi:MAG: hypothetical protein M1497_03060 [Nitrospirae bacterium]|nr:hypothetical protein [Nitrospirota bacterium]
MRRILLSGVLAASITFTSCGGGGGVPSSGSVALFATDDMSSHRQVITTLYRGQISKPGAAGSTCEMLSRPVTLDLSNLSSVMQLLNVADCTADTYSTIHLEFQQSVKITDQANVSGACSFTSFKDSLNQTHALNCAGGNCSIDLSHNYNVSAGFNRLVLDFILREFEVNDFPSADCTVGMKVSSLSYSDADFKKRNGYQEGLTGYIAGLSTSAKTFVLNTGTNAFSVNYSMVSLQNIDQLLQFAVNNNLRVNIESSEISLNSACIASALFVKVGGVVSGINAAKHTFVLTHQTDKTLSVDYSEAEANGRVKGRLDEGTNVEVRVKGFNGTNYLADQVEASDVEIED